MSTVPGQDAKDKGNAAFKAGDFPGAIGHYTAAVLADPQNPTYTLNRAAAYLRLGKHEDAERDCDVTIKLDPKNVKAWFRRGQARSGLEKFEEAKEDYKRILQLDPSNDAAKQELAKVEGLLQYRATNAGKKRVPIDISASSPKLATSASPAAAAAKRRRVPIKIVEPLETGASASSVVPSTSATASTSSASDDFMKPVSTRTLSQTASSSVASSAKATSFKDLKQARDTNKPSPSVVPPASDSAPSSPPPASNPPRARVGGGIFRANGQHTIFGQNAQGTSVPQSESSTAPSAASQPPAAADAKQATPQNTPLSLFNFNRMWNALRSPQDRWMFLVGNAHPTSLPSLFKTSLETALLVSMLETFKAVLENAPAAEVKEGVKTYLLNFARVPRFTTVVLFMSKTEKQLVKEVWDGVSAGDDQVERGARKVWGVS